jgi:hypothetical protein
MPYNEFLPSEDLASYETGVGSISAMNLKMRADAVRLLNEKASVKQPREK